MRKESFSRLACFIVMCPKLINLSLKSCAIEDQCLALLSDRFLHLKHLQKLELSQNRLTDLSINNSLSLLMYSPMRPPFTDLILSSNSITVQGAQSLFNSISCCRFIKRVSLDDNRIDDEFVIWLQRFLRNREDNKFLPT